MLTKEIDDRKKNRLKQLDEWQTFVDSLDVDQLHLLNEMVCKRIDYLRDSEINRQMLNFRPGDQVSFVDKKGSVIDGRVFKLNRKTVSVVGENGGKWNVSPGLLQPAQSGEVAKLPIADIDKVAPEKDWIFGLITLPGSVKNEGDYFVPKVAVWLDGNGLIRHMSPLEPGEANEQIFASFDCAQASPAAGPPCVPLRVKTDQSELIDVLKSQYPQIQFYEEDVPEILEVAEEMRKSFNSSDIRTYKDLDIPETSVAAFFDAAAQLYKCSPWSILPSEYCLIGVSIEALGVKNKVISVIGQQALNFGVLLFDSIADHLLYSSLVSSGPEHFDRMPTHSALAFESGENIAPAQRKEVMGHGWQVAGSKAYPELFLPVEGGIARYPTADDLLLFEVLSRGMAALLGHRKEIKASWNTGKPFLFSHQVSLSDRELDISFSLPATPDNKPLDALSDLEAMALIDRTNLLDPAENHAELVEKITARFEASDEYRTLKECNGGHTLLMELGFNYLNITVASCLPEDLQEVLYELIPRKVMITSDAAGAIVDDLIAFYRFLKREYRHPIADECLAVLGPAAKITLCDALDDDSKFGIGKSTLSQGDFPFSGIDLPPAAMLAALDPTGEPGPGNAPVKPTGAQKKSRKNKRKSAQKSRKRNRR